MLHTWRKLLTFVSLITIMLGGVVATQAAAPPNIVTYQGRVLNTNGVPVSDSSVSMKFALYNSLAGGTCLWSNDSSDCYTNTPASIVARSVTLTSGLFTENLGDTTNSYAAISDTVFADNNGVYLEVIIAGETLTPRRRLTAAPYALNAQRLDGIDSTGFLAANGDTATGEYDLSGAELVGASPLVFEGGSNDGNTVAFSFTDPSADRTITFQNASGTVAFTSDITSSQWETGVNGIFEDDAAIIVGIDTGFTYSSAGVGDMRIADELEVLGDGFIDNDLVIGASTSSTETLAHPTFALGGDDLFVAGTLGVEGMVYSDGGFTAGTDTAFGSGAVTTTGTTDLLLTIAGGDLAFAQATTIGDGGDALVVNSSDWDISATGDLSGIGTLVSDGIATFSANLNANGGMDVDDAFVVADGGVLTTSQTANFDGTVDFDSLIDASAGVVQGASPLVFEGLTANDFETSFAITDPTADNTITFQNTSGTVAFLSDIGGGGSLFTDDGTVTYLTSTTDDLAIGAATLVAPFSVDVDTNILRVGDGTSDVNDPTITFYASDATDSGSISFVDADDFLFTGGDLTFAQNTIIGDGGDTLALDSSDWDINATGDLSGIGTLVSDGIATFSANLNANGGLDVDDAFVVADGGVLTTSAAANFDNTADFDGNVLVSDTDVAFDGVSTTFTTTGAFTLTPGGAVVLGDGVDTMQVNTSDWDVSITGDLTGIGSLTMDGVFSGATSIATTGDLTVSGGDITGSNGEIFDIGTTNSQFVMEINTDSTATLTVSDITDANTPFTISAAGTGTLTLSSAGAGSVAVGDGADTVSIDSSDWDISATGDLSGIGTLVSDGIATFSANLNANGGMDVDDAFVVADGGVLTTSQTANFDGTVDFDSLIDASAGVVQGASPLVFEGLTANDFETTFAITDPTADNIITFQNGTGTVAFLTDVVGGSSLFTDGGTVSYLTSTTDDLAVGGTALASPFSVDVDINTLRIGDGANDVNNPTVTFYASDATDSGSLSYLDTDGWFFSGGDVYVGNDSESISSTEFSLSGNDVYLEDSLGVNGTIYGDDGLKILGEFNQNIDILNAGSTITTGITGMFKSTFTGALSAARQDTGLYTTAQSDVSVTTQDYTFVGDYVRAKWDPGAPGITPTGSVNIYGRLTDFTTGNITNLDNLIGHRFSIGEGNSINDTTISNAGFIDGRFIPGSGTAITNFKGIYLSADDNSGAGTINDARGLDVSFTDAGAASFTSAYGIYVSEVQATNAYGVYVASVTGSSNDYSVYTADNAGNAAFLDNVFVGATSEDITDGVFTVGGDDFFVSGQLGVSDLMRLEASFAGFSGGFFNDGGLDDRQGVYIQGCLDTSPTTACNFLELRDGDGTVIGAIEGNGAGGVTNSSAGSDYAELFPGVLAHFSQGDILALDEEGNVTLATQTNDLIGAYSVSPNVLGNWVEGWETIGNAVPVALLGQVPVQVNDEGGSITIGDYLTLSSVPGVAKKATGVGFMLGRALASHSSGNGTILVFIEPTWQALDLVMDSNGTTELRDDVRVVSPQEATQQVPIVNSPSISLRGSVWNESVAQALEMKMKTVVQDPQTYRLSVSNTAESEVAYVTNEGLMRIAGDMIIGGRIYPSDRGVPQTEKYIYYDGSEGSGGDFMRTNAKGWSTGSYDFAEMFFSNETLKAGEVVVFDKAGVGGQVHRSTGLEGEQLAGIVSTRPGFLAGENNKDNYPIALAGRVPTRVNLQGGAIAVGDPLAASTEIGVATKATKPGSIIGYALEAYDGRGDGLMLTFVNMSYWGGAAIPQTQNTASQVSTQRTEFTNLNVTGDISMNGYAMLNVGRLVGFADTWSIESDGTIQTQGLIKNTIASHQGEMVETIAVVSPEAIITLSGTAELVQGEIEVRFEDVAPEYNDVISATAAIRVVVTPDGPVSLYVSEKDQNHFVVKRFAGEEDSSFDWIVTAYRRGYEPVEEEQPEETIEVQTTQSEPSQENQSGDEISESEESVQIVEEQVTEESQTQEVSQEEEEMTQKTEDPSTPETSVIQEEVVITP